MGLGVLAARLVSFSICFWQPGVNGLDKDVGTAA